MTDCDESQTGWRKPACASLALAKPLCGWKLTRLTPAQAGVLLTMRENLLERTPDAADSPPATADAWRDWLEAHHLDGPAWLYDASVLAKVGFLMSWGTGCACCLGWRALVLAAVAGVVGFLAGAAT